MTGYRPFHRLGLAVCGVIALGATGLNLGVAQAHHSTCRTDPTVTLSNGVTFTMWADIQTDISQVSRVSYQVHVPAGVTLTSVTYDSSASLETVQILPDQAAGKYWETTTVQTSTSGVGVTAYASGYSTTLHKTGTSGTPITVGL